MALVKRGRVQQPVTPVDRAAQWHDIDPAGQRELSGQMHKLGHAKRAIPVRRAELSRLASSPDVGAKGRIKAQQRGRALEAIAPTLENKPITLEGAAQHRIELARAGGMRAQAEGVSSGANWYYEHHQKLADVASSTGIDKSRVIAASASMSPQNSPDQEHAAVKALAEAHAHPDARIHVTHEAVDAAVASVPEDPNYPERATARRAEHEQMREYVGKGLRPKQLTAGHLAMLSTPGVREHVGTKHVDLGEIAKGGGKGQVAKAIGVLRGDIAPEEANSPINAPKVWSYHQNIAAAVPGTQEQQEFLGRAHAATTQLPGQGRFDLTGLQGSQQGLLTEHGHTAEDSWMHAINTQQQLASVNIPGRTGRAGRQSPAKFMVGEGGGVSAKSLQNTMVTRGGVKRSILRGAKLEGLEHAWSNRATNLAAQAAGMPSTAVQGMAWTEARRRADKDPIYEAMRSGGDVAKGPQFKQQEMFAPGPGSTETVRKQAIPPKRFQAEPGGQKRLF